MTIVENENHYNEVYGIEAGNDTIDKIYLLSTREVRNEIFGFSGSVEGTETRKVENTNYRQPLAIYCAGKQASVFFNRQILKALKGIDDTEASVLRDIIESIMRYESEGIKRIISILNFLISVYNNQGVCLVVDELDSGIFEYLLEKLSAKNIYCSTINLDNRYITFTGVESNNNKRDYYIRTLTIGGQKEKQFFLLWKGTLIKKH